MIALILALASAPLLPGLETGQSLEFVARIDCQIQSDTFDLNGAASSSRMAGASTITFLFPAAPDDKSDSKTAPIIPVVELDTSSYGTTNLFNVEASAVPVLRVSPIPQLPQLPQLPIFLNEGEGRLMTLSPRGGSKSRDWDYKSTQVAVHGALIKEKGICKLTIEADAS